MVNNVKSCTQFVIYVHYTFQIPFGHFHFRPTFGLFVTHMLNNLYSLNENMFFVNDPPFSNWLNSSVFVEGASFIKSSQVINIKKYVLQVNTDTTIFKSKHWNE